MAVNRALIAVLWERQCAYCANPLPLMWDVEHILPKSRGGSDELANLVPSCGPCNLRKAERTAEEFGYPRVPAKAGRIATLIGGYLKREHVAVRIVRQIIWEVQVARGRRRR